MRAWWWCRWEAGFCGRLFGVGIYLVDHRRQRPLFSERHLGVLGDPWFHVGPWHVELLYPDWLRETVINPLGICFRALRPVRRSGVYGREIGFATTPRVTRWRRFWRTEEDHRS